MPNSLTNDLKTFVPHCTVQALALKDAYKKHNTPVSSNPKQPLTRFYFYTNLCSQKLWSTYFSTTCNFKGSGCCFVFQLKQFANQTFN